MRSRSILLILLIGIIVLPLSKTLVHLLTEAWWFHAINFSEVFWTRLKWQVLIWIATFLLYTLFLWGNYRIAMHRTRHRPFQLVEDPDLEGTTQLLSKTAVWVGIGLIGLIAAAASASNWEMILKFLHATPFGQRDPILQQDISFYIFKLPFYEALRTWLLSLLAWSLILSIGVYSLKGMPVLEQQQQLNQKPIPIRAGEETSLNSRQLRGQLGGQRLLPAASLRSRLRFGGMGYHLSGLLAALALLVAWGFWLDRYHLLYQSGGTVFGAGYTDVHARLWAYGVISLLAAGMAGLLLLFPWRKRMIFSIAGVIGFGIALVLLTGIYPWLMQQWSVIPNELEKEKPYLEHNIRFTQAAYRLQDVQRQNYVAEAQLDRQILQNNQPTIRNIRLWDYHPLLSTYRQLQEIRLYYTFPSVDVDRYTLNGNYQQVMLSARELSFEQVPAAAQTWVNQRLKYTHGYGLVMSPVNQVTADGLPQLDIKDIPPVSTVDLKVSQPAIYYGEATKGYIITGTTTDEFDYPLKDINAFTRYQGKGGVPLSSFWRKLAYAYDRSSLQILISNYLTNQSRIHYYRSVLDRVDHVAPFLRFDRDPYLSVVNGRLQWIVDAYTVSDRYPYSQPVAQTQEAAAILSQRDTASIVQGNVNYIRNSVKVVVDAYDGTLRFFAIDAQDPILSTYQQIFPHLFEPAAAVPPEVKAHFRYPQDLFMIQSQIYLSYHMSDPEVFYNREDLWQFPIQTYEGAEQIMQPYYVIMRLPGEDKEGFILILPFTPARKDNMITWMAARSNGQDYGKLLLYEFPKQKLVYGPRQIEARIDQDPQISQQFTLWSQAGSKVIRGDLLVIPIEQSLLYVEPVYLRAEQGELPELKRVIVAYDKSVVMEETLEQGLAAIFGSEASESGAPQSNTTVNSELVKSAWETYQQAQTALRQGDWAEYGRLQQTLEQILKQLNQI